MADSAITAAPIGIDDQPVKEWHADMTSDIRSQRVRKLVQALLPPPVDHGDPRATNIIHYARKVEMEMYKTANSRDEYEERLTQKTQRISQELKEKREQRMKQVTRQTNLTLDDVTAATISGNVPAKEWHTNVTLDMRSQEVRKLLRLVFQSPEVLSSSRRSDLINYIKNKEVDIYRTADSREEYNQLLENEVSPTLQALEEKCRQQRRKNLNIAHIRIQNRKRGIPPAVGLCKTKPSESKTENA